MKLFVEKEFELTVNALAGTVEVWTIHNALSSGYGPIVHENIIAGGNVVDAEIAKFRLS